jgi:nucleotide-binding universal stress UspA family protein
MNSDAGGRGKNAEPAQSSTVLAACDGSEPSLKGVAFAAGLAKALGASLELVYVSFPSMLPMNVYATAVREIEAAELQHAKTVFDAAERSVADVGVAVKRTRLIGAPADAIADRAAAPDVWGVVIGARGHNAVTRVMLGSVADRLAHICPKPAIIVR